MDAATGSPDAEGRPAPPPRMKQRCRPINRRRWNLFRAQQAWLLVVLDLPRPVRDQPRFRRVHRQRQAAAGRYDGAFYMPVFSFHPETEFGGEFETEADYRDPFVQELIAEKNGWMVWPVIRYSYRTVNNEIPVPAPARPSSCSTGRRSAATMTKVWGQTCQLRHRQFQLAWHRRPGPRRARAAHLRVPPLRAVRPGADHRSVIGDRGRRRRGAGLFRRLDRPASSSACIEVWTSIPSLYLLIIIAAIIEPTFWMAARHPAAVLLGGAGRRGAGGVPARAQFRICQRRTGARRRQCRAIMFKHLLPNAMVATLTFMPFILNGSITTLTSLDFLGFGLPPGSPSLGELLAQGKANLQAPWLGADRLLHHRHHAQPADLHRRGGARRARSAQDLPMSRRQPASDQVEGPLRRLPPGRAMSPMRCAASRSRSRRARPWRWSANPAPASRSRRCRC